MRQVMQAHKKTGRLLATLPSGVSSLHEPCQIEIALKAGKIVSSAIVGQSGSLLTGERAYQELTRLGRLRWTFTSQLSPIIQPEPVPHVLEKHAISLRPRRIVVVEQQEMRPWQRMHRLVYALVDGRRSVADIAKLLSMTPETIEDVLSYLRSIRVIVME
jgi:hypothetical protein